MFQHFGTESPVSVIIQNICDTLHFIVNSLVKRYPALYMSFVYKLVCLIMKLDLKNLWVII